MLDVLYQAITWLGNIIGEFAFSIASFFVCFLPEPDTNFYGDMYNFFHSSSGSSFNIFAFVDWSIVSSCASIAIIILFPCLAYKLVMVAISIVHKIMDSMPIVG